MKYLASIFFAAIISVVVYSQTQIHINFDLLQNGNQLSLDSVVVVNQSTMADTSIYNVNEGLSINMYSSVNDFMVDNQKLSILKNYPNPFTNETYISIFNPGNEISISVYDISGKKVLQEKYHVNIGEQNFVFSPDSPGSYIINFASEKYEKSVKLICTETSNTRASFRLIDINSELKMRSSKDLHFTYTLGDNLEFTGFVTVCNQAQSNSFVENPGNSQTYSFDFTGLSDIQPESPVLQNTTIQETSLYWSWNANATAAGYKYNFVDDYETAIDMGLVTSLNIEDLIAGTNYEVFLWAYNVCGQSNPLQLNAATAALPLTQDEIDLITEGEATVAMTIMNIFLQPDSVILRTPSTNVIIGEEHLNHFTDRMKKTVVGTGVGIAAVQVGVNRRIMWVQRHDKGSTWSRPWELYYNPRIVQYSDTVLYKNDGCLSVPTGGAYPSVGGYSYRAIWVDVEYYLPDGTHVVERINHQYTAHIFQHEIDHLEAIMFFDRQVRNNLHKYTIIEGDSYEGLPNIE